MSEEAKSGVTDEGLSVFTEYFVRNYPGPDTIIGNPLWHAPKIYSAAIHAYRRATPPAEESEVDLASDERWNAGVNFAITCLCGVFDIDPKSINWDAATETLDGDVSSVLCNVLVAAYGEEWSSSLRDTQAIRALLTRATPPAEPAPDRAELNSDFNFTGAEIRFRGALSREDDDGMVDVPASYLREAIAAFEIVLSSANDKRSEAADDRVKELEKENHDVLKEWRSMHKRMVAAEAALSRLRSEHDGVKVRAIIESSEPNAYSVRLEIPVERKGEFASIVAGMGRALAAAPAPSALDTHKAGERE